MKKFGIMVVVLAMLVGMTGFAMADAGVNQTPETAGISSAAVVQAFGVMVAKTDLSWYQSDRVSLQNIPGALFVAGNYYTAAYNEDTQVVGNGDIEYTKTLEVDTAEKLRTESNIEAFKQFTFAGEGAARMLSDESIFVEGMGQADNPTGSRSACFWAAQTAAQIPPYCNSAEASSAVDVSFTNGVTVESDARFIMKTMEPLVELNQNTRVFETIGKASTDFEVIILDGRNAAPANLGSKVTFKETRSIDGDILLFDVENHYESGWKR